MILKPSPSLNQTTAVQKTPYAKLVIRRRELAALLGISRSTTYLREKPSSPYFDPLFPKSIQIGKRAVGFLISDVMAYIEALAKNPRSG